MQLNFQDQGPKQVLSGSEKKKQIHMTPFILKEMYFHSFLFETYHYNLPKYPKSSWYHENKGEIIILYQVSKFSFCIVYFLKFLITGQPLPFQLKIIKFLFQQCYVKLVTNNSNDSNSNSNDSNFLVLQLNQPS